MWCMTWTWYMTEVSQASLLLSIAAQVFLISRPNSRTCETYCLLPQKFLICIPCCIGYLHYAIWNCFWSVSWCFRMGQCTLWIWTDYFLFAYYSFKNSWEGILCYILLDEQCIFPFLIIFMYWKHFQKIFCRYQLKLIHSTCSLRFICLFLSFYLPVSIWLSITI